MARAQSLSIRFKFRLLSTGCFLSFFNLFNSPPTRCRFPVQFYFLKGKYRFVPKRRCHFYLFERLEKPIPIRRHDQMNRYNNTQFPSSPSPRHFFHLVTQSLSNGEGNITPISIRFLFQGFFFSVLTLFGPFTQQ